MSTSSFSPSFHPNSPYTPKTINKTLSPSKRKRKVFHNNNANSGLKLRKAINRRRSQDKTQSILSLNKEIGDHFSRLSDSAWLTIRMGSELCDYKKNEKGKDMSLLDRSGYEQKDEKWKEEMGD